MGRHNFYRVASRWGLTEKKCKRGAVVVVVWVKKPIYPFGILLCICIYVYTTLRRYNNNSTPNAFPSGKRRIVFGFVYIYILYLGGCLFSVPNDIRITLGAVSCSRRKIEMSQRTVQSRVVGKTGHDENCRAKFSTSWMDICI